MLKMKFLSDLKTLPLTLKFMFALNFLVSFSKFMVIPFLAVFFKNDLSMSASEIGFLLGLTPLASMIFNLLGGRLSDVYGIKILYVISLFVSALTMALYGVSVNYLFLAFVSVFSGIGWSIYNSTNQALLSKFSPKELIQKTFNINYWFFNLGGVAGPLVGAILIGYSSFKTPLFSFAGILFIIAIIAMFVIKIKGNEKSGTTIEDQDNKLISKELVHKIFKNKSLLLLFSCYFLLYFIESQMDTNIVQYAEESFQNGVLLFAKLLTLSMVLIIILQPIVALVGEKIKTSVLVWTGGLMYFTGPLLLLGINSEFFWYAGFTLITLGEIILAPTLQAQIAKLPDDGYKTTYFSFVNMGGNMAFFVGPWIGGIIFDSIFIGILFGIMSGAGLLASTLILLANKKQKTKVGNLNYTSKTEQTSSS
ncbi:MFS transporter (plasmid) [Alkalihalobacillus hwajinpoensis]|uniref:MFS transporter n=1 Tax=Guptibacillus hwajinpoensis TaxID=208199 RepID=UPI0018831B83|nr:MFS transporter [Pseudalkalibacillus hwajinpoensis]MBF0706624.1 MFS transporter [Pseudalkalibacillus hwajinpoensis]